jgi:hypothetical protein
MYKKIPDGLIVKNRIPIPMKILLVKKLLPTIDSDIL